MYAKVFLDFPLIGQRKSIKKVSLMLIGAWIFATENALGIFVYISPVRNVALLVSLTLTAWWRL